jgi:uncharacterized damage-inducible protein DinB
MSELEHIRDQLWRSLEGEAWHGPALLEALAGVDAAAAAARPVAGAHTIWEITLHLTATVELVEARLAGEPRRLAPEEDWPAPPADASTEAWQAAVTGLKQAHGRLLDELTHRDDVELDAPVVPGFSSLYVILHGLVQHNLYHAGQIVLLAKAQR